MKIDRQYTQFDRICLQFDQMLRALTDNAKRSNRPYPAADLPESPLSDNERKTSAALMRINHAGEICAQALYHSQALASRQKDIQGKLSQAVLEEGDHLAWCKQRLDELGSHTSYLNPLWYGGSFAIGMVAGMVGDKWSLGFVAETEQQVVKHLEGHLHQLPRADQRSYAILKQMSAEEDEHKHDALALGAQELPGMIKKLMAIVSKIMVKTAYYI